MFRAFIEECSSSEVSVLFALTFPAKDFESGCIDFGNSSGGPGSRTLVNLEHDQLHSQMKIRTHKN